MRREFWRTFWAIVAVVFVALPHLPHMHPWISILLLGAAGWRLGAAECGWRLPGPKLRVPLVCMSLAGVAWNYHRITGIEAGSALLLVMLALKLLETRRARDRSLISIICFVLMFAAFLREQAIWSIAYLAVGVGLCLVALLQADNHAHGLPARATLRNAGRLFVQALPLMALLFLLFPRVPGPFWALPTHAGDAATGLADTVSPGDITALGRSDEVAFRVRFSGAVPEPAERYWRGPVMSYFNGTTWSWRLRGVGPKDNALPPSTGRAYDYEITLEPHNRRWLLALESPVSWDHKDASYSPDWQLINEEPVVDKLSYQARSVTGGSLAVPESERYLQAMQHLPACLIHAPDSANTTPPLSPCWPGPGVYRRGWSRAISVQSPTRWGITGSCGSPTRMPGSRFGWTIAGSAMTRPGRSHPNACSSAWTARFPTWGEAH
ncbi:MAG: DUF3488 domain-containing protein [Gammaproteobacteria bacterium]